MAARLVGLGVDAREPERLAQFWSGVLGSSWSQTADDGTALKSGSATRFGVQFVPSLVRGGRPNRMHLHLASGSLEEQQQTVARALSLGGRQLDVGQLPEEEHVVLADPEGNEFCVIEPGNKWLAGCGFLAEVTCDGSRDVGVFWSQVLGWPLVWDEDGETAIQSSEGGPKVSWGGPPLMAKTGPDRLQFHLAAPSEGDLLMEVARLASLGATRVDANDRQADRVLMVDPDGHDFTIRTAAPAAP